MSRENFVGLVIDRLEVCFKDMHEAIHKFKRDQQMKSYQDLAKPVEESKYYQKQNEYFPDYRLEKQKKLLNTLPTPSYYLGIPQQKPSEYSPSVKKVERKQELQMTEEQKEELRKKLNQSRPKPPMNAFISFVKAQKQRIKNNSSKNLSIAQITAIASEQWKSLTQDQKDPYIREYQQSHVEYITKRDQFIKQNPIVKTLKLRKPPTKPLQKQKKGTYEESDYVKVQNSGSSSSSVSSSSSSSVSSSSDEQQSRFPTQQESLNNTKMLMNKSFNGRPVKRDERIRIDSYEQRKQKTQIQGDRPKMEQIQQKIKYKQALRQQQMNYQKNGGNLNQNPSIEMLKQKAKQKILSLLQSRNQNSQMKVRVKRQDSDCEE